MDNFLNKTEQDKKFKDLEARLEACKKREKDLTAEIDELTEIKHYYDILMENTEDFFLICDKNGKPRAYNNSFKKTVKKCLGVNVDPDTETYKISNNQNAINAWSAHYKRVLNGDKFKADYTVRSDRGEHHFETAFCPIKKDGEITGFTEITRDITERKNAEKALKKSDTFNTSLLDHSPNAIIVFNNDTSVKYVNPLFVKMTGYTAGEAIGKKAPYPWWVDAPEYGTIEHRLKLGLKGINNTERKYRKKNGDYFWVELNVTPIFKNDKMHYTLSTWVDITERKESEKEKKQLEEKLQRSQKMESIGLLAGGVAHDLNNILAGIVSYPELLLLDLPEDSSLRGPIKTIMESGNRAVAIVQDLLTIARGVATAKNTVNLNDLVNDYLNSPEFNTLELYNPSVNFKTDLDYNLLNISGSYIHMRKVIMNLAANASEAIETGGNVTISTRNRYLDRPLKAYNDVKTGEYAVLSVSDSGTGISDKDLNRIFEPFYSRKVLGRSGTGLGLAVVWNVMLEHNGYINVSSSNKGTTFDLYFPITRNEITNIESDPDIRDLMGNGEKILIVDDIESQRDISKRMLEKLGYRIITAASGEEAVEFLKEQSVDLVLLDMIMDPGMNGRETYEKLLKINPYQKAVIVSGFAETSEVKTAQKLGAGPFIKKPVTFKTIGLSVKNELLKKLP